MTTRIQVSGKSREGCAGYLHPEPRANFALDQLEDFFISQLSWRKVIWRLRGNRAKDFQELSCRAATP
jgi:hypothetical protein